MLSWLMVDGQMRQMGGEINNWIGDFELNIAHKNRHLKLNLKV